MPEPIKTSYGSPRIAPPGTETSSTEKTNNKLIVKRSPSQTPAVYTKAKDSASLAQPPSTTPMPPLTTTRQTTTDILRLGPASKGITANESLMELLTILQTETKKSAREDAIAKIGNYVKKMRHAANKVRNSAAFHLAATIVSSTVSIAAGLVSLGGTIKSAKMDKKTLGEVRNLRAKMRQKNLADADGEPSTSQATDTSSISDIKNFKDLYKQSAADMGLTDPQLDKLQQITRLSFDRSTRITQQTQAASHILEGSGRMIGASLDMQSQMEQAQKIEAEAEATEQSALRSQSETISGSAADSINKFNTALKSIIDSEKNTYSSVQRQI